MSGAQIFLAVEHSQNGLTTSLQGFSGDDGIAVLKWKTGRNEAAGVYTAIVNNVLKSGYEYSEPGAVYVTFTLE